MGSVRPLPVLINPAPCINGAQRWDSASPVGAINSFENRSVSGRSRLACAWIVVVDDSMSGALEHIVGGGTTMGILASARQRALLAGVFCVAVVAPVVGFASPLSAAPPGPAVADCALGYLDDPSTPGQCVPVPGESQERTPADTTISPSDQVGNGATGPDLSACGLNQPYLATLCPGAPPPPP